MIAHLAGLLCELNIY